MTTYRLYISEERTIGRAIAAVLTAGGRFAQAPGDGFIRCGRDVVTWARGHLLEAAPPEDYSARYRTWNLDDLPIWPAEWQIKPSGKKGASDQLRVIGTLLKSSPAEVVHVGDPDREGQLIIDEILTHFGWGGKTLRMLVQAVEPEVIRRAMSSIKDNQKYRHLSAAAECRRRADWAVGMNLSRAASLALSADPKLVISIGRVQTPTLAIVVRRDLEIEGHVLSYYYTLVATLTESTGQGPEIELSHSPPDDQRITSERVAKELAGKAIGATGPLTVITERKREAPPRLFTLPTLQRVASARWKWGLKKTLDVASSLYLKGVLTYPRTECPYLPEEQKGYVTKTLAAIGDVADLTQLTEIVGKNPEFRKSVYDSSRVEEHHALVPTTKRPSLLSLTEDERNLYRLVAARYISNLLPDRVYDAFLFSFDGNGVPFRESFSKTVEPGWRRSEPLDRQEQQVPAFPTGDQVTVRRVDIKKERVKPPAHFTEGTLQAAMESAAKLVEDSALRAAMMNSPSRGLGTAATQYSIIETLKERGYVAQVGSTLRSTQLGRSVVASVPRELTDPRMTALWEQDLDGVAKGVIPPDLFLTRTKRAIVFALQAVVAQKGSGVISGSQPIAPPPSKRQKAGAISEMGRPSSKGKRRSIAR